MPDTKVLFMQSQTYFGADSFIHSLLMRNFDREKVEVYVACNVGSKNDPSASYQALRGIPDIHIRPTDFGPSLNSRPKKEAAREALASGLPALRSLLGLCSYIKKNRINVIHCTEKPRDAFLGFLISKLTGAKCVIHLHVKAENWISPFVRWAMKHTDAILGVSSFVADSVVAMDYPEEKVHFVLNSIDIRDWDPTIDGSKIRQEFEIPEESPLLAIISRLFYWKGHTELIKALGQVKTSIPNVKLLIVGEDDPRGMPGHGSYTAELKSLVSELGLSEQVIFTGFRRDIRQILAAADIYTMPSFEEPFGVVYLEAMAMKKPVIALDNGGTREVVENGKSGLLSAPQDIEQLASNITRLIGDPQLRHRMGEYGRSRVETFFTPARMACDVEQIYQQLNIRKTSQPLLQDV